MRGDVRVKDDTARHRGRHRRPPPDPVRRSRQQQTAGADRRSAADPLDRRTRSRWAKQSYPAADHVLVMIYPNPLNPRRYVVINSGHTFRETEFRGTNALVYPRLGDFAVLRLDAGKATAGNVGRTSRTFRRPLGTAAAGAPMKPRTPRYWPPLPWLPILMLIALLLAPHAAAACCGDACETQCAVYSLRRHPLECDELRGASVVEDAEHRPHRQRRRALREHVLHHLALLAEPRLDPHRPLRAQPRRARQLHRAAREPYPLADAAARVAATKRPTSANGTWAKTTTRRGPASITSPRTRARESISTPSGTSTAPARSSSRATTRPS